MAHDDKTKRKPSQKDIDLLLKASEQFFAEGVPVIVESGKTKTNNAPLGNQQSSRVVGFRQKEMLPRR